MSPDEIEAFHKGVEEGYKRYAWWKDGVQYVGSCGTTLAKAREELAIEHAEAMKTGKIKHIPV